MSLVRQFLKRFAVTAAATAAGLALVGGAYAFSGDVNGSDEPLEPTVETTETPEPAESETPEPTDGDDEDGVRGGSVERVHDGCEGVEGLEGNWTHGDYVSAIAALGDPEATRAAAHSDCGKPVHSVRSGDDDGEDPVTAESGRGKGKGRGKEKGKAKRG